MASARKRLDDSSCGLELLDFLYYRRHDLEEGSDDAEVRCIKDSDFRAIVYNNWMDLNLGRVTVVSKRLADTAAVSFALALLSVDITFCLLFESYLGTYISLIIFISVVLIILGYVPLLHRRITSGRLVLQGGFKLSGFAVLYTGFLVLAAGPRGLIPFPDLPQAWMLYIVWISFWLISGTLPFYLDAIITRESRHALKGEAARETANEPSAGAS